MDQNSQNPLPLGTVVHERYRVNAIVGRGGLGTVYSVSDTLFGKQSIYALKEMADQSRSARHQFEHEAQWLQALDHNHIPKVREYFEWRSRLYLVMDFVDGENLEQKLYRQGGHPLPEEQVIAWILPICDALNYLHTRGPSILHRDVKPANIIVTPAGHPVLVDLGIAKEHLPGAGRTATFVRKAGTEGYAPPEQYTVAGKSGPWSDVYALGATLYHLLTTQVPVSAIDRVTQDPDLIRPAFYNRDISQQTDAAICRAMAMRPVERFQSIADFATALPRSLTAFNVTPFGNPISQWSSVRVSPPLDPSWATPVADTALVGPTPQAKLPISVRSGPANSIFISYRRDDSAAGHAGHLRADLARRYGVDKVFMDVSIEPGVDFVDKLENAVGSCKVLLAVIGRNWLTVTDAKTGKQRLNNPMDWVRVEIATALKRNVRVIPVLFHGAHMATADDLPDDLKPLARRQALEITDTRWDYDVDNLLTVVDKILDFKGGAKPS